MQRRYLISRGGFLAAAVLAAGGSSAAAFATTEPHEVLEDEALSQGQLTDVFLAIDDIPASVLAQGDEAVSRWLQGRLSVDTRTMMVPIDEVEEFEDLSGRPHTVPLSNKNKGQEAPDFNLAACVGTIGLTFLTGVIPVSRIVKVKEVFKAAGGATQFVKTFYSAYRRAKARRQSTRTAIATAVREAARAARPDARAALLDLFGITTMIGNCT